MSTRRLPSSLLADMARMDLALATPFSDRSAALLVPRFGVPVPDSAYYIMRENDLGKVRDALKSAQVGISELRVRHPSGDLSILNASELNLPRPSWSTRLWGERPIMLAGLAALLLMLSYLTFTTRLSAAVADTEQHLVSLEEQAKRARTKIDTAHSRLRTLSSLQARSPSDGSVMLTIADLTHVLPDGTFLTDIEIAGAAVNIAGYSNSASALIGLLQDSGRFSNVRFSSSVTRAVGFEGERFSISMERAHAG
ncbi:MAG TPA: PilN domain-containing protein [Rhizobium sp.]|nr:PilN domain-containing protein [Rhizobium sp.]